MKDYLNSWGVSLDTQSLRMVYFSASPLCILNEPGKEMSLMLILLRFSNI